MRTAAILLGLFGGIILGQQAYIPIQLRLIIGGSELKRDEAGLIAFFACWAVATALLQRFPGVAIWMFSTSGVAVAFLGHHTDQRPLIVWGALANVMAVLAILAHREWRLAEQAQRARDWQLTAIAAAVLGVPLESEAILAAAPADPAPTPSWHPQVPPPLPARPGLPSDEPSTAGRTAYVT